MKDKNTQILEYAALAAAVILCAAVFLQVKNRDVNFCRSVFSSLIRGRDRAQKDIDWESFKAVGADVGAVYRGFDDDERADYKKAFIESFARGFKGAQGRLNLFTNWRIYDKGNGIVVAAADYKPYNKTLLFFVSKYRKTKLIGIQWKE